MDISEKIRLLRNRKGFSQEDLADKVGVSRQSISKWESGQAVPEISKLLKLSKIFDITSDQLINPDLGIDEDSKNGHSADKESTQFGNPMGESDKQWFLNGYIKGKKIILTVIIVNVFFIITSILLSVLSGQGKTLMILLPLLINASFIVLIIGLVIMLTNRSKLLRYWAGDEIRTKMKNESKSQIKEKKLFKIITIVLIITAIASALLILLSYNTSTHDFEIIGFSPTFFTNSITIGVLLLCILLVAYVINKMSKSRKKHGVK